MYVITESCPVECMAPLLKRMTFAALVEGMKEADEGTTVGDVICLFEKGRLTRLHNIGWGRMGEIHWGLIRGGVIEPESLRPELVIRDAEHHMTCGEYVRAGESLGKQDEVLLAQNRTSQILSIVL